MKTLTRGQHVTCNGNPEAHVLGYYSPTMVEVRLYQGFRHVGDVCVSVRDLLIENPSLNEAQS